MTKRTSLKLTDDRQRKLERASKIVAADEYDEPPMSVVIDAALTHLLESEKNIQNARDKYDPKMIQTLCNTSVIGLQYRTLIESRYR